MAAKPDNPDDYATKGDLYNESQAIRSDIKAVDDRLTKTERSLRDELKLVRTDITALTRMVRTIMDHLGISEPSPPAR